LISEISSGQKSPFYIDFSEYPRERDSLPIGVFDSGTGGLTVLNALIRLDAFDNRTHEHGSDGIPDFVSEKFIYLGDKANMPYGRYPSEGLFPKNFIAFDDDISLIVDVSIFRNWCFFFCK